MAAEETWTAQTIANLLLISNSICHGRPYLEHCADAIRQFLGGAATITFVPYAAKDWNGYTTQVRSAFAAFGFKIEGVHETGSWPHRLPDNPAIFVGGGNTFRLLKAAQDSGLLDQIRQRTLGGMLYMGSSAGANLACPTIKTTNDMPIMQPADFNALGLVSFQINPHYIDTDPSSKDMGETREKRIAEFHEETTCRLSAFARAHGLSWNEAGPPCTAKQAQESSSKAKPLRSGRGRPTDRREEFLRTMARCGYRSSAMLEPLTDAVVSPGTQQPVAN